MATAPPPLKEWLIILPDNAGMLQKRMEVRPKHLENLKPSVQKGIWTFGGATLDVHPAEGEAPKANGSVMLGHASSESELLDIIKNDIYSTSGVWDLSKVKIYPFRSALRRGMIGGL